MLDVLLKFGVQESPKIFAILVAAGAVITDPIKTPY